MAKKDWKAEVNVTLKKSVLDPQGETIKHAVHTLGYKEIENVRIGKFIEVDVLGKTKDEAEEVVKDVCHKILVNPVIETATFKLKSK